MNLFARKIKPFILAPQKTPVCILKNKRETDQRGGRFFKDRQQWMLHQRIFLIFKSNLAVLKHSAKMKKLKLRRNLKEHALKRQNRH